MIRIGEPTTERAYQLPGGSATAEPPQGAVVSGNPTTGRGHAAGLRRVSPLQITPQNGLYLLAKAAEEAQSEATQSQASLVRHNPNNGSRLDQPANEHADDCGEPSAKRMRLTVQLPSPPAIAPRAVAWLTAEDIIPRQQPLGATITEAAQLRQYSQPISAQQRRAVRAAALRAHRKTRALEPNFARTNAAQQYSTAQVPGVEQPDVAQNVALPRRTAAQNRAFYRWDAASSVASQSHSVTQPIAAPGVSDTASPTAIDAAFTLLAKPALTALQRQPILNELGFTWARGNQPYRSREVRALMHAEIAQPTFPSTIIAQYAELLESSATDDFVNDFRVLTNALAKGRAARELRFSRLIRAGLHTAYSNTNEVFRRDFITAYTDYLEKTDMHLNRQVVGQVLWFSGRPAPLNADERTKIVAALTKHFLTLPMSRADHQAYSKVLLDEVVAVQPQNVQPSAELRHAIVKKAFEHFKASDYETMNGADISAKLVKASVHNAADDEALSHAVCAEVARTLRDGLFSDVIQKAYIKAAGEMMNILHEAPCLPTAQARQILAGAQAAQQRSPFTDQLAIKCRRVIEKYRAHVLARNTTALPEQQAAPAQTAAARAPEMTAESPS